MWDAIHLLICDFGGRNIKSPVHLRRKRLTRREPPVGTCQPRLHRISAHDLAVEALCHLYGELGLACARRPHDYDYRSRATGG